MLLNNKKIHEQLGQFIASIDTTSITKERITLLDELTLQMCKKLKQKQTVLLHFICTHNSRRSQLAQIWSHTLAQYFNVDVVCFSGGTEVSEFADELVKTVKISGFSICRLNNSSNPFYSISFSDNHLPIIAFSKKWNNSINPQNNFIAVMTCSHADENCPLITGAEKRISINYADPKNYDNTDNQQEMYNAINKQIATELYYTFSKISIQ